jgi:LemA protein
LQWTTTLKQYKMPFLLAFLGIIVFIIIFYISTKNGLIGAKNSLELAKGSWDAMLKKRYDLIPNLVATVKQYSTYEENTLTRITELRAKGMSGTATDTEQSELNKQFGVLGRSFMALSENYPDLKASSQYTALQGSLNETEEQIAAARRSYNAAITAYNNKIEMFPGSLFASGMGLSRMAVPTITEEETRNVDVKQLFNS